MRDEIWDGIDDILVDKPFMDEERMQTKYGNYLVEIKFNNPTFNQDLFLNSTEKLLITTKRIIASSAILQTLDDICSFSLEFPDKDIRDIFDPREEDILQELEKFKNILIINDILDWLGFIKHPTNKTFRLYLKNIDNFFLKDVIDWVNWLPIRNIMLIMTIGSLHWLS